MFATIAGTFLVILNVLGIFYYLPTRSKTKSVPQYDFLDPSREIYKRKDLIINFQPLRDYLEKNYQTNKNVSIYFEFLNTGANIDINKDSEYYPASLLKVPVAMTVAKKIENGVWKWTNDLVLMSGDKDGRFGTLYKEPTGSTYSINELVRRSLSESDNTAHFILLRNLELSEVSEVYDHLGMSGFVNSSGLVSAKQYSVIMRALYSSSYLNEANSSKLINFLMNSSFNQYLQSGLPAGVPFSHKIGVSDDGKVYLDSGIVYVPRRPYLLTVMIKGMGESKSLGIMKDVSQQIYQYINDYEE